MLHQWPLPWLQRLFVLVIVLNIALLLAGIAVVPSMLDSAAVVSLLGAMGMQAALAALALRSPWSFAHYRTSIMLSAVLGVIFAGCYLGIIVIEFHGVHDNFNIAVLFVVVAFAAGVVASARSRQWQQGLPAAIWALLIGTVLWSGGVLLINYEAWGSRQQYGFWLADGAIDDFHRSGSTDFSAFLLQDLYGALFFHPLFSVVVGAIGGLAGGGLAWAVLVLQQWVARHLAVRV
jgi:hypothetical protein